MNILADYPSNTQFQAHFREFLFNGYKSHFESVITKFPYGEERDGTRIITDASVGLCDGQTKILLMYAIVSFAKEILSPEEIQADETIRNTLESFRCIRCSYQHLPNPKDFFLQSLRSLHAWSNRCQTHLLLCCFLWQALSLSS